MRVRWRVHIDLAHWLERAVGAFFASTGKYASSVLIMDLGCSECLVVAH